MNIEPGKGVGKYRLGEKISHTQFSELNIVSKEQRDGLVVYKAEGTWFFVDSENILDQISVFAPCEAKALGKVGIGNTLQDVLDNFGHCTINHKAHEPVDFPGISFETENGSKSKSARIECISVSMPYKFYGGLPEHINQNKGNVC